LEATLKGYFDHRTNDLHLYDPGSDQQKILQLIAAKNKFNAATNDFCTALEFFEQSANLWRQAINELLGIGGPGGGGGQVA
jgi:hypothetical protein